MRYSISDLEQLSGVQTHTIRIWERRYQALSPLRSDGNTRFYDDSHLRRLLNIVGLSQKGMKISQVCALSDTEVDALLDLEMKDTQPKEHHFEFYISQLLSYGLCYDEYHFDQLISKCIAEHGMGDSYKSVIFPMLVRLGLMWRREHICPGQEHFLSGIIRQKLFSAVNEIPPAKDALSAWLLFLPEDEDHDMGLLFANYLLRAAGQRVIYLGSKVPMESLQETMAAVDADRLFLFMVRNRPVPAAREYLAELIGLYPGKKIMIAGNEKLLSAIDLPDNIQWLQSVQDFEMIIKGGGHVN
jgi:DNA-binding transcriptional MerR regulator